MTTSVPAPSLPDLFGLRGKRALILGGGRGIGEGAAALLSAAGARLVVVDVDPSRARDVVERLGRPGVDAAALQADITDDAALVEAVEEAGRMLGGLDILVAIVGVATFQPAIELSAADWDRDMQRTLRYVFLAAQAFARIAGPQSAITVVGSMSGVRSASQHAAYGAAKAGLLNLVRTLAVEWAGRGVRVNAVTPGSVSTPAFPDSAETQAIMRDSLVPLGRSATVDEVCRPILFLSSDMASYVTGHNLLVDGGWGAANLFRFGG